MSDVQIIKVEDKAGLKKFVNVTREVYKDDPNWIQPLSIERMDVLSSSKNPYFNHADVCLFLARQDGKAVGRISVQIDTLAQEKWGPDLAHFGFFEACNKDAALALVQAAEQWASERGMKRLQGPWSFSSNEECGMLIDGFDTPPVIMMPHGRPDYKVWMEDMGFKKAKDLFAYAMDIGANATPRTAKIHAAAKRSKKIKIRQIDMKRFDEELAIVMDIFNDAWSDNWGYVKFTEAEAKHTAQALKPIIKPYRTWICEYDGELVAFMVTIPDINHKIRDLNGKLLPFGIFKLLWRMLNGREDRVRVPLMGVRKRFQKSAAGALMPIAMIEETRQQVYKRGARFAEMGWILEDNAGMITMLEEVGGTAYKTNRIWEKPLHN